MGGRQRRRTGGRRQETGDRRQKTIGRHQEPGLGGRKTGWFADDADDGWYKVLRRARVSTVPRDCWRAVQSFQLTPFSFRLRRVRRRQRGMRRGARTAHCTLRSRGREWWCGGRRRRRALEGAMELKKREAVLPRSACGASSSKQQRRSDGEKTAAPSTRRAAVRQADWRDVFVRTAMDGK